MSFINCTIVGPAVVVLLGESSLQHTSMTALGPGPWALGTDAFWPFPDDRQYLVGVPGLVDCHISRCQLQRIGPAVPQSRLEETMRGFGL